MKHELQYSADATRVTQIVEFLLISQWDGKLQFLLLRTMFLRIRHKTSSRQILFIKAHLAVVIFISSAECQWKNISSGSLANTTTNNTVGGTLLYRNGILWAFI